MLKSLLSSNIFKWLKIGDVTGGNYIDVDENGVMTYAGTAKRKITLRPVLTSTFRGLWPHSCLSPV